MPVSACTALAFVFGFVQTDYDYDYDYLTPTEMARHGTASNEATSTDLYN